MADKTEIPRAKHTLLWSGNAMKTILITIYRPITKFAEIFKMASKMAAENIQFNISDCKADKTEIPRAKHTFLWSGNAMKTKLIIIYRTITKFVEIFKMASNMATENRKLNISDCIADKAEIPSAKHTFLWSRNAISLYYFEEKGVLINSFRPRT